MIKLFAVVLFLSLCGCTLPQMVIRESSDPMKAYESAKIFVEQVEQLLKNNYPSRVEDPTVKLKIYSRNGKIIYQFTWSCQVTACEKSEADWYFDRRGTMLSGKSMFEAFRKVEKDLAQTGKIRKLKARYDSPTLFGGCGGHRMPDSFVSTCYAHDDKAWWCVREFFITAPKP